MKSRVLILFALLFPIGLFAQERSGCIVEAGIGYAPLIKYQISVDDGANIGFQFAPYLEWRYACGRHLDFGARLRYKIGPYSVSSRERLDKGVANQLSLLGVADFNMSPNKAVNPFFGIQAGPTFDLWTSSVSGTPSTNFGFGGGARAGIEIKSRLVLSADYYFSLFGGRSSHPPVLLNVGWVF